MRVKVLITLKLKLSRPCNKFVSIFRFKLKKPVFIRAIVSRPCHVKLRKPPSLPNKHLTRLLSYLCFLKKKKKKKKRMRNMNRQNEIKSFSDAVSDSKLLHSPLTPGKKLFPSPLTPAYVRARKAGKKELLRDENMEDACRSFENYLVCMIVEEGKVEDLTDIEELLYCWRKLKSPVFIDLVSRFYGELCRDLFSTDDDDEDDRDDNDGQK